LARRTPPTPGAARQDLRRRSHSRPAPLGVMIERWFCGRRANRMLDRVVHGP
jgi:hypothetical protein